MQASVRRAASLSLAAALLAPLSATAQQLTVERIFASPDFTARSVSVDWAPDGESFVTIEYNEQTRGTDLWVEGIRTGKRTRLVEGSTLTASDTASRPIQIEEYAWSADRSKMLIFTNTQRVWRLNTKGEYYVYDVRGRRLTPLSTRPGWQMFAKFSPDGRQVGFVRDNNLFVVDLASGAERQLTQDGSELIINGTTDWVYEEELDLRDAWRWSPDGKRIAFWRFDQSPVPTFYMLDDLAGAYSRPIALRYPKAGAPNSKVRVGAIELASGETTWLDVGNDPDVYLARMDFAGDSPTEVVVQRLNRHQNRLDLLLGDVATGSTRPLLTDADSAWVDVDDDLTWLRGGRQFLWSSERDGWNHLYLYNRDGTLARQLTRGAWEVSALEGVDEKGGWVYFTAANPGPRERQLFRVRLDGSGMQRITTEPGTHGISLSPTQSLYLDRWSRDGVPPVFRLHDASGKLVRVVEDNAQVAARVRAATAPPEPFTFTTSDGVPLNGFLIKPKDFDPSKKYPVLMYVYGGPGSQTVTDAWGGTRYLWHQLLAERGYLVASVDNRGTGARGRDFKKVTYLNLGKWESHDQIEAARYLGSLPYVDAGRIGIWGWSYGGYMTALTLMKGGSVFKGGISVAPVADWRLYDNVYTERFMRTPQENPRGYDQGSTLTNVEGLRSALLLVHGTGDDNVHFQNSEQLSAALQAAGKQFDFMMYPNRTHSISGGNTSVHLFTLLTDWVTEKL